MNKLFRKRFPSPNVSMMTVAEAVIVNPVTKARVTVPAGAGVLVHGQRPTKDGVIAMIEYQGSAGFMKSSNLKALEELPNDDAPV